MSAPEMKVPFGRGEVPLPLEGMELLGVVGGQLPPRSPRPEEVRALLHRPTAGSPLGDLVGGKRRLTVIAPDHTRRAGAGQILAPLVEELRRMGCRREDVTVLVGTGLHRPSTGAELERLLGGAGELVRAAVQNEPDASGQMLALGATTRGTPLRVHRVVVEAELVILTGSIGFHYFAGFTGGRKAVLPAACARESIFANHRLSLDLDQPDGFHPRATYGVLAGNPVHEDMLEALGRVPPAFLLNTLEADPGRDADEPVPLVAGDPVAAHLAGCRLVLAAGGCRVSPEADLAIVSAGGAPHDIDFIQSHKALEHSYRAVRPGGTIVFLAECIEGVGSEVLLEWLDLGSIAAMKEALRTRYALHAQTALALRRKTDRHRVILFSALSAEVVRRLGMIPAATPAEALRVARAGLPPRPGVMVFLRGTHSAVLSGAPPGDGPERDIRPA